MKQNKKNSGFHFGHAGTSLKKNQAGFVEGFVITLIVLLLVITFTPIGFNMGMISVPLFAKMVQDIKTDGHQVFCDQMGVTAFGQSFRGTTGAEGIPIKGRMDAYGEQYYQNSLGGDLRSAVKQTWWDEVKSVPDFGSGKLINNGYDLPPNSWFSVWCDRDAGGYPTKIQAFVVGVCEAGQHPELSADNSADPTCVANAPTPGLYFTCLSNVCTQKNCPADNPSCATSNSPADAAAGCTAGAKCGTEPPTCSEPQGCKNVFSEVECSIENIPTNRAPCLAANPDSAPLNCPYTTGIFCDQDLQPDTFCAGSAGCRSPEFFACKIGTDTGDTFELDGNYANTDATFNCTAGQNPANNKWGVKCDTGKVCDLENKTCIDPKDAVYNDSPGQYNFELDKNTDRGIGINYKPTVNADYFVPQICIPDKGVYCPECLNKNPNGKDALLLRYDQFKSKGATVHFTLANRNLVGQKNYALMLYKDYQKVEGSDLGEPTQEKFVVKIDAGKTGACQSETAGFSGPANPKPVLVEYNWNWDHVGSDYCQNMVCDSTQFTLMLLKRLKTVQDTLDDANVPAQSLLDFNAWLMADGYTQDFRNDFDRYYKSTQGFSPSWYTTDLDSLSKYLTDGNHLFFDPPALTRLGNYRISIDIVGDPGNPSGRLFDSNNNPDKNITVSFNFRTAGTLDASNLLYYLPIDGGVGGETGNSRQGYGIGVTGEGIHLNTAANNSNLLDSNITSDQNTIAVAYWNTFSETNLDKGDIERRGRILQITRKANGMGYDLAFAPTTATPVAIKIVAGETVAVGHFQLEPTELANSADRDTITTWTQLAGGSAAPKPQELVCSGFNNEILIRGTPENDTDELSQGKSGFEWNVGSNVGVNKTIVLGGVFYTPSCPSYVDPTTCAGLKIKKTEGPVELITPNGRITASNPSVALNFTATIPPQPAGLTKGLKIESLQDVVNLLNKDAKALCVYSDSGQMVVYWNRNQLLNELKNKNDASVFGATTKTQDLTSLIGGHTDWLCSQVN